MDEAAVQQCLLLQRVSLWEGGGPAEAQVLRGAERVAPLQRAPSPGQPPSRDLAVHQGDVVHDEGLTGQLGGAVHD